MARPFLRACAVAMFFLGVCSNAHAHLGHVVLRAERYIKIDAEPRGVRLVVSLTMGPAETQRILADADADGDGTVDDAETEAYMRAWGEGLAEDIDVWVDGERVEEIWGEAYLDPPGEVRAVPGAVEMVARVPLLGGEHEVRLQDGMARDAFDRTDIAFTAQPGATLIAAGSGAEVPTEPIPHVGFDREEEGPTEFVVRVSCQGLTSNERWGIALGAGAGVLLLIGSMFGLVRARRRRASAA